MFDQTECIPIHDPKVYTVYQVERYQRSQIQITTAQKPLVYVITHDSSMGRAGIFTHMNGLF